MLSEFLFHLCLTTSIYFLLDYLNVGRKHWYLTLYSSIITTAFSVYFFLVSSGPLEIIILSESVLSRSIAIFFIVYCLLDLGIGFLQYPDKITYGGGWVHHLLYVGILSVMLYWGITGLFGVLLIEELPTVILAVGKVKGKGYREFEFGLSYFLTRIGYHCYVIYQIAGYSHLCFGVGMMIFAWHLNHYRGWLLRYFEKNPSVSLVARAAIFAVLSLIHIVTQIWIVYSLVSEFYWYEVGNLIIHFVVFSYTAYKLIKVLYDVYQKNFIAQAIQTNTIIYNISWEDPAVDCNVLNLTEDDVLLTICSAGCNVLHFLCDTPAKIIAADINPAQLSLLELKLAALKTLEYEQFFSLFAKSDYGVFEATYETKLRPELSSMAQDFWDNNHNVIRNNLMYAGTSGFIAKLFKWPARITGITQRMQEHTGEPLGDSVIFEFISKIVSYPLFWRILAPLGGVPLSQIDLVAHDPQVFVRRIKEVMKTRMWVKENYFYYGYVCGEFTKEVCPRYLKEENFQILKENCDRVEIFQGTWAEASEAASKVQPVTVSSLLDSMDWMPHSMIAENISRVVSSMVPGGRIFWRSFAPDVHSPVLAHLKPSLVDDYDLVGWYLTQFLCTIPDNFDAQKLLCQGTGHVYSNSFAADLKVMSVMVYYGLMHSEKNVSEFYKSQGEQYDGFRETLLPGRDKFMKYAVPWINNPRTWVSVGCGTARDLEYVIEHVVACNTKVYLLDLAPSLLQMARKRVEMLQLQDRVTLIEGDITKATAGLPEKGTVDLVTCSFCLTMIPNWEAALQSMYDLVSPKGHLGLIDFTIKENHEDSLDQRIYKLWFQQDGVYFNRAHIEWLKANLKTTWYSEESSRCPYTPFYPSRYLFCGQKL